MFNLKSFFIGLYYFLLVSLLSSLKKFIVSFPLTKGEFNLKKNLLSKYYRQINLLCDIKRKLDLKEMVASWRYWHTFVIPALWESGKGGREFKSNPDNSVIFFTRGRDRAQCDDLPVSILTLSEMNRYICVLRVAILYTPLGM